MEKQARIIMIAVMVIVLSSFVSADNATINATGSEISPLLINNCNITGQIGDGIIDYTLFKDDVNISSGHFPVGTNTSITSIDMETTWTEVGTWLVGHHGSLSVDEDWGTYSACNAKDDCYSYPTTNYSYLDVYAIRWFNTVGGCANQNNSLPEQCIVGENVSLRIHSDDKIPDYATRGDCWNGTTWVNVYNCTDVADDTYTRYYEGLVEINHSSFIDVDGFLNVFNYSVVSAGSYIFSCRLNNFSSTTAWSNSTAYNSTLFNISVYDEQTGLLITDSVDIWLYADDADVNQSLNQTFTGGSVKVTLNSTNYRIIIESVNYTKRNYYYPIEYLATLGDAVSLFLLNESAGSHIIIKVIDEYGYAVENAVVYIYKTIPVFNQEMVIGILNVNFEGEASFDFVLHTDDYRFIVYNSAGTLLKTTSKTTIDKEVLKIQTVDITDPYDSIKAYLGTTGRVWITNGTTSNRTGHFYFSGDVTYGCIRVKRATFNIFDEDVCEECLTASSGVVTCDYNYTTSGTYFVSGLRADFWGFRSNHARNHTNHFSACSGAYSHCDIHDI